MRQLEFQFGAPVQERAVEDLIAEAMQALQEHHGAWLVGDPGEAERQRTRLRKIAEQLNLQRHGDPRFGTLTPGGGERTLEQALKAPDGHIPLRGQPGRFLLTCDTFRAIISYPHLMSRTFDVHALDVDHPFISATGYRSFSTCRFDDWNSSPSELAQAAINAFRMEHPSSGKALNTPAPLTPIDQPFRDLRRKELLTELAEERSDWLAKALSQPPPTAERVAALVQGTGKRTLTTHSGPSRADDEGRASASNRVLEHSVLERLPTAGDDLQQYFNFDAVAVPVTKQADASVAIRAAARASQTAYDPDAARAEALRGWRGLIEGRPVEVADAFARGGETISNLLTKYIKGGIPSFEIRGAIIDSPADFAAFCLALRTPYFESLKIAILDNRNQVIHSEVASVGTLSETVASPQIFSRVLAHARQANPRIEPAGFVIAHNHPSGVPSPSDADRHFTTRMEEIGALMKLPLVDHVITNGQSYYSFRESGVIREDMRKWNSGKPRLPVVPIPPSTSLADWEVTPLGVDLPRLDTPCVINTYLRTLRTADPDHHHAIYLNAQQRLMAAERIPATLDSREIARRVIEGAGRNAGYGVAFGLRGVGVDPEPTNEMRSLVSRLGEAMALAQIKLVDAMAPIAQSPGRTLGYFSWATAGLLEVPAAYLGRKASEPEATFLPSMARS